jgi:hypothetical protein
MRASIAVSLWMGLCAATAATAHAQPADNTALAEQLFNEGRELGKASNWAAACPKFEASLRYDPAVGTRLNLAICYEKLGKLATAWGQYREAADVAAKQNDTKRRDFAQKAAAALEPRLPKLTIVAPKTQPPGLVITRDGTTLDLAILGSALFIDPGAHEVTASAPDFATWKQSVSLGEGKAETVTVPELTPKPGEPPPKVTPDEKPLGSKDTSTHVEVRAQTEEPASPTRKYIAIGVAGGGAVLVGVGLLFGSKASSKFSDAKNLCGSDLVCDNPMDFQAGQQLVSDARSKATISTITVIAGSAAIAGGVVLWLTAPGGKRRTETAVVPVVTGHDAGLAVLGRF